jgi:crotonobetainyl-CoA:carnitine CoA-transferase CaiB-like acyl-CoA transferase
MMLRSALEGLTVLDFTQIGAGPTCTMLLADMGARVVKIEPPQGELGRTLGPSWIGEDAALFHGFNRNKLGMALDLKKPEGAAIARRLAAMCDVVVESMRPGVMNRLGLGYERLSAGRKDLLYCSISAYGQQGPYADRAGVDGILQADSGLMSLIGLQGAEPCKVQAPVVDVMTGYVAAMAIAAKLRQRDREGLGGHLDVNLLNCAIALQQSSLTSYLADGQLPDRVGSAAPYSAPNQAYRTLDGWIMVAAYTPDRWTKLCEVIGAVQLSADRRFTTSVDRVRNRDELTRELERAFVQRTTAHWLDALLRADILCARVATYADVEDHPQVRANGMIAEVQHHVHGSIRAPGFAVDSAASNAKLHRPAPERGQHSRAILRGAGLADREIESLVERGIVYCSPALQGGSHETASIAGDPGA